MKSLKPIPQDEILKLYKIDCPFCGKQTTNSFQNNILTFTCTDCKNIFQPESGINKPNPRDVMIDDCPSVPDLSDL